MRILSPANTREVLSQLSLTEVLEKALIAIAQEQVSAPPRMSAVAEKGKLSTMVGVAGNLMVGKFISVFPGNHNTDVPSHQGCLVYFDGELGTPLAVMDTGVVTAFRTSATTAVAAEYLLQRDAEILTIVGSGTQGRAHYRTLQHLRGWKEIRLVSRNLSSFDYWNLDDSRVEYFASVEQAVQGADAVALCTSAESPVVLAEWLPSDVTILSVGGGVELTPQLVDESSLFVEWYGAAEHAHPAGSKELQGLDRSRLTLIGDVIDGKASVPKTGRVIYKTTGHPAEDAFAAQAVFEKAQELQIGMVVDW